MIKALFFDCFGVLYVDVSEAYFAQFPQYRQELRDLNTRCDHGFLDHSEYVAEIAKITGVSKVEVARAFAKEHTINRPLINYITRELKPHYRVGMISNIGRGWMQDFFNEHQLHDLFDAVVLSSDEGITKPNPLIFERALERMGVLPAESLFIDDRQENCDGAQAAGMHSLLYDSERGMADIKEYLAAHQGADNA